MKYFKIILKIIGILILFLTIASTINKPKFILENQSKNYFFVDSVESILVSKNIPVKKYFQYLDSIVKKYNEKLNYKLTEHLLVRYNSWIIDTLKNTDYYAMMKRDSFVFNQKDLVVLRKGSSILVPDSIAVLELLDNFKNTYLDINIPEFKLRIVQDTTELFKFPVRVGRNERKYLKMGDRITDLKTKLGVGKIVNHVKNPDYYNPSNGHQYFLTKRDDNKITKLPQIP